MESSFRPSLEEINYLVVASLVVAASFTAYRGVFDLGTILFYAGVGPLVLLLRELGQRTVAQWMESYTELELSLEGSALTIAVAVLAVLTKLPILLLIPVYNEFSGRKYEHWGKTISAMWMKRQYWIASGGIVTLLLGWMVSFSFGFTRVAEAVILFTVFQLLPIDHPDFPSGALDGAYILRWSGFVWLVMMGFALVALGFSL